ncbi:MAG: TIGR02611 family protein [Mycobacteriales bacterium]
MPSGMRSAVSAHRDRIRGKRRLGLVYRVVVAVLGLSVIVVGFVLLPLPGPGWLVIFLGLGILASEFAWAQRLLDYAKERVAQWTAWVRRQSALARAAMGAATLAVVAAVIYGYHLWRGLPDWLPGVG